MLDEKPLGVREFCRLVATDPGFMSGVLSAKRPPPIDKIPIWTKALEIPKGEQRDEFQRLGYLTHCPDEVWDMFQEMRKENELLKRRLASLNQ
jgi:hypothetical protein